MCVYIYIYIYTQQQQCETGNGHRRTKAGCALTNFVVSAERAWVGEMSTAGNTQTLKHSQESGHRRAKPSAFTRDHSDKPSPRGGGGRCCRVQSLRRASFGLGELVQRSAGAARTVCLEKGPAVESATLALTVGTDPCGGDQGPGLPAEEGYVANSRYRHLPSTAMCVFCTPLYTRE